MKMYNNQITTENLIPLKQILQTIQVKIMETSYLSNTLCDRKESKCNNVFFETNSGLSINSEINKNNES